MSFCTEIQIGLNSKLTTEDFVKKFGFAHENELRERIIKMFPYKHEDILRRLKSNDRLAKRLRRSDKEKHVSGEVLAPNSRHAFGEVLAPSSDLLETNQESCEEHAEISVLEQLRQHEESLIKTICEEEASREMLLSHKHTILDTLRSQRTELSKLEVAIRKMSEEVDRSIIQLSHTCNEIEKSNSRLSDLRQQLENTQAEIKSQEKIVIYVLSDGSIMSDDLTLEVDEDLYLPLFQKLSENTACENLTIKEVRQLARLLAVTSTLDTKFDILFDSTAVEEVYQNCK
ncbi:MAG: hypothetical protein E7063_07595 [Spirochaetaceae bacterium]|nr:hypothetical protein [Spirochaetaceae bacterium]